METLTLELPANIPLIDIFNFAAEHGCTAVLRDSNTFVFQPRKSQDANNVVRFTPSKSSFGKLI